VFFRRKKAAILIGCILSLALAGGWILHLGSRSGEDILSGPRGSGRAPASDPVPAAAAVPRIPGAGGGPLFRFGSPYLDGRSAWLAVWFLEDRNSIPAFPVTSASSEPTVECRVHRAPFTAGAWVSALAEDQARQRKEVESQAVESRVTFFVPGGEPRAVLRYLVGSGFLARIPGEGTVEREIFFPPFAKFPEGLCTVPDLAPNEWMTRERWSRPLALPTEVFFIHAAFREGELLVHVLEAWENVPGEGKAAVRLAATQQTILGRPGGCVVRIAGFYSGQGIPAIMDPFVVRMTCGFWRKVAALIAKEAMTWKPDPAMAGPLERLGN